MKFQTSTGKAAEVTFESGAFRLSVPEMNVDATATLAGIGGKKAFEIFVKAANRKAYVPYPENVAEWVSETQAAWEASRVTVEFQTASSLRGEGATRETVVGIDDDPETLTAPRDYEPAMNDGKPWAELVAEAQREARGEEAEEAEETTTETEKAEAGNATDVELNECWECGHWAILGATTPRMEAELAEAHRARFDGTFAEQYADAETKGLFHTAHYTFRVVSREYDGCDDGKGDELHTRNREAATEVLKAETDTETAAFIGTETDLDLGDDGTFVPTAEWKRVGEDGLGAIWEIEGDHYSVPFLHGEEDAERLQGVVLRVVVSPETRFDPLGAEWLEYTIE